MRTFTKTLLAAALAALLPAAGWCAAEKMEAVAAFVQGDAQLVRGGEAPVPLKLNEALYAGDSIKTGAGAKVSVITKTGAEVRVNENSVFAIPKKEKNIFELAVGQVWSRMLHKKAKLSVRTPSAVCAIRGTEADIEQKQQLTVKVYEGHVDLMNKLGKQPLRAGQMSTVASAAAAPAAPRQMTPADQGTWQGAVEIKDLGRYFERLGLEKGQEKDLQLKVNDGGKSKDIKIKLKKK